MVQSVGERCTGKTSCTQTLSLARLVKRGSVHHPGFHASHPFPVHYTHCCMDFDNSLYLTTSSATKDPLCFARRPYRVFIVPLEHHATGRPMCFKWYHFCMRCRRNVCVRSTHTDPLRSFWRSGPRMFNQFSFFNNSMMTNSGFTLYLHPPRPPNPRCSLSCSNELGSNPYTCCMAKRKKHESLLL